MKITARIVQMLLCLVVPFLAACSGFLTPYPGLGPVIQEPLKAPPSQQIYRVPRGGVESFDPAIADEASSVQAIEMVFTGLVQLDNSLNVRPQLAQSWEVGPDGLAWTFHLKYNLKFSDGTPLTSHDVAYSIDRALQPATNSQSSLTFLSLIKGYNLLHAGQISSLIGYSIFTPDDNTVIMDTNKKAPYFLNALTFPSSFVVEKKLIAKYGKTSLSTPVQMIRDILTYY